MLPQPSLSTTPCLRYTVLHVFDIKQILLHEQKLKLMCNRTEQVTKLSSLENATFRSMWRKARGEERVFQLYVCYFRDKQKAKRI